MLIGKKVSIDMVSKWVNFCAVQLYDYETGSNDVSNVDWIYREHINAQSSICTSQHKECNIFFIN